MAHFDNAGYSDGPRHGAAVCALTEGIGDCFFFFFFFFLLRHEMTAFKLPTASSLIIGYIDAAGCVFILAYSFYWPHFAVYPNPQPQQAALAN